MDENYTRNKIKALMNERGTAVAQLADALGVSQYVVYHWFSRGTKSYFPRLGDIAKYYNVSVEYLTGHGVDDSSNTEADQCLSTLKARPELRTFFNAAKDSTNADIEIATILIKELNKRKG